MKLKTIASITLSALVLTLGAVLPAQAFNPVPEPPGSLVAGLTEFDAVAIHVFLPPGSTVGGVSPTPFRVGIYDASGRLVASMSDHVPVGHIVTLQLKGAELGVRGSERARIYGVVECLGDAVRKIQCAQSINANLEVYDVETGRTQVSVPLLPAIVPVVEN